MDWTSWICFLVTLIHVPVYRADKNAKLNVTFDIWEGSVTVLWDHPPRAPEHALYQLQISPYESNKWDVVPECNMTTETRCFLGNFSSKYEIKKVKIELFEGNNTFSWSTVKRIRFSDMKLFYPEFKLFSTYNVVKVKIQKKQFLKKFFDYGPSYSAVLYPKGQENQAITISDVDEDDDDEDGEVEFTSLSIWQEYCVRVKVDIKSDNLSNTSLPHCIYTLADPSMLISITVFGVAGVLSFFMFAVCFFLRRPGKMPAALKSAVHGWHPMNVGLIQVETVTDKGWLLTSNKIPGKTKAFTEDGDLSDEERRESTDSGVSVSERDSVKNRNTGVYTGEEDSGCGSLTGNQDSFSGGRSLEELPFLDGEVDSSNSGRKEDSGLGSGNQDVSILCEIEVGVGYRSQSPSADAESETIVQCDEHSNTAIPANGYRSGHVICSCSDFDTCMWCKTRKLQQNTDSLSHEQTSIFTSDADIERPSYLQKSPLQTVNVSRLEGLSSQSDENCSESSLFITCPLLLQEPCNLDTMTVTLGDVELKFT